MATVLIAAMGLNRVIGREGDLPWHQPADLAHFKKLTLHHPVIMGRKTFESFEGTLPGRLNIVVTRNRDYRAPGADVADSLEAAIATGRKKQPESDIYIAGGGEIYTQALTAADRIELTLVHAEPEGDAEFPALPAGDFRLSQVRYQQRDSSNPLPMTFLTLKRA
ncbi:MAG: type 3 dihydrofolate reductase [Phycisphaerales bacterium]